MLNKRERFRNLKSAVAYLSSSLAETNVYQLNHVRLQELINDVNYEYQIILKDKLEQMNKAEEEILKSIPM